MKVWQVLERKGSKVETVDASGSVAEAVSRFVSSKIRSLLVTDGGRLVGVLTIRDVLGHLDEKGGSALEDEVRAPMSGDLISVSSDTELGDVEGLFKEHRINHLPVLDDGELKGLLTPSDVLTSHLNDVQGTNATLIDYIAGGYY